MVFLNPPYSDSPPRTADQILTIHRVTDYSKLEMSVVKNRVGRDDFKFLLRFGSGPRTPRKPRTRRVRKARTARRLAEAARYGVSVRELAQAREAARLLSPAPTLFGDLTLTKSGRLSSSKPNLANVPREGAYDLPSAEAVQAWYEELLSFPEGSR